ncbi:parathyroid hormone [Paroedura picta]|uniref:parathyroid hormone n=1 Tax=Paroedura picta TaxID=143630 RepID=UPI004055DAF0
MTAIRNMARTAIVLWAVCLLTNSDGKAMMKRSVSEVQMMHDLAENIHSAERQRWLLEQLQNVHHDGQPPEVAVDTKRREVRSWRLMPDHLQTKMQKRQKDWNKAYRSVTFKTKPQ